MKAEQQEARGRCGYSRLRYKRNIHRMCRMSRSYIRTFISERALEIVELMHVSFLDPATLMCVSFSNSDPPTCLKRYSQGRPSSDQRVLGRAPCKSKISVLDLNSISHLISIDTSVNLLTVFHKCLVLVIFVRHYFPNENAHNSKTTQKRMETNSILCDDSTNLFLRQQPKNMDKSVLTHMLQIPQSPQPWQDG